ncbi:MAG: hypothetical protein ABFD46_05930 [Armatimonadota bacterium]
MKRALACIIVLIVLVGGYFAYTYSSETVKSSTSTAPHGSAASGGQMMSGSSGAGRFEELQKEHKYAFQLLKMLNNVRRLEESGKEPLTKNQAKAVLVIVQPLRKKESLDETSANEAIKALQAVITDKQRAVISALPAEKQFRQGGPPPGAAVGGKRPSSPPSGGAGGPGGMKNFNPLNQPAGGPPGMKGQRREGLEKLFDDLKKKSEAVK